MKEGIKYTGVPSKEELAVCPGVPSQQRMRLGRVAVIECIQEIPCNPCENACRFGAIHIGQEITNVPHLKEEKCTGCGLCIANCPGLAITVIDKSYAPGEAAIDFPFEYLPLPKEGDSVEAVSREGAVLCKAKVLQVKTVQAYEGTAVISICVPLEFADDVKSMKRLQSV